MDSSGDPLKTGIEGTYKTAQSGLSSHELAEYAPNGWYRDRNKEDNPVQVSVAAAEMREVQYKPLDSRGQVVDGRGTGKSPEVVIERDDSSADQTVSLTSHLLSMWYLVVIIVTPIVCLPILLLVDDEYQRQARCGYTIAVMAVFWTTEALPIAVTSLMPVVMLPMLGVLNARETSGAYFNDTSMLFVGGLLVAIAIEVWDVHKRIALLVLRVVGAEPRCLLLGITLVTWFLSMWISNTATTAMMMTTAQALLEQFRNIGDLPKTTPSQDTKTKDTPTKIAIKHKQNGNHGTTNSHKARLHTAYTNEAGTQKSSQSELEFGRMRKALSITVAYSANIGGIGSLTGTGPNLVLFANAQREFEKVGLESPITFSSWLVFGFPLSLLVVAVMWVWINLLFLRCRGECSCMMCNKSSQNKQIERVNQMLRDEYRKLGPITYAQGTVMISFVILVILWIARDIGGAGGWADWFPAGFVSDSTPSLLMGILMFVLPATFPTAISTKCDTTASHRRVLPLLNWRHVHEKMPWSLFLLLGGGYAIARAATESGLSDWLGEQLLVFRDLDSWLILLIICYTVTFATEVIGNTALTTLLMPILAQMALSLEINPLFFMFPAAISTSFAFMLPVATPPNAIVFSAGGIRVIDMMSSGLVMNIVCVPLLILATATWGNAFFNFDTTPVQFLVNQTLPNVTASSI